MYWLVVIILLNDAQSTNMKLYRNYFLILLILSGGNMFAQSLPKKDSINVLAVHQMSAYLSLSSQQEQAILAQEQQCRKSLDSIDHLSLAPQQRTAVMSACIQQQNHQIKLLLTEAQWAKYSDMLKQRRAAFLQHAADKKIIIQELPGQNP